MQVEWKMVHVLVAIATRIAVATVIPIVPCNDITLCLFVCIYYLLFIYLFVNIIGFLHMHILYVAQYTIRHIYVSAIEQ